MRPGEVVGKVGEDADEAEEAAETNDECSDQTPVTQVQQHIAQRLTRKFSVGQQLGQHAQRCSPIQILPAVDVWQEAPHTQSRYECRQRESQQCHAPVEDAG